MQNVDGMRGVIEISHEERGLAFSDQALKSFYSPVGLFQTRRSASLELCGMALVCEVSSANKDRTVFVPQSESDPEQAAISFKETNIFGRVFDLLEQLAVPVDVALTGPARKVIMYAAVLWHSFVKE